MRYPAVVTKEGRATLAEFPDCPGCQTFAEPREDILAQAEDALRGWLEATLAAGEAPARPAKRVRTPRGGRLLWVSVPAKLAVKLSLRWQRQQAGLTQAQLAKRAKVSQQQIAKLEDPDSNPTIETLEKVAKALGAHLEIALLPNPA
jgi:DNA-binding XRE family transcriptional regulator/predicted RNase H-like HicB family nuclease